MNLSKYKLLKEDDNAFHLHDGEKEFPVVKRGLSNGTIQQIQQHFSGGGSVVDTDDPDNPPITVVHSTEEASAADEFNHEATDELNKASVASSEGKDRAHIYPEHPAAVVHVDESKTPVHGSTPKPSRPQGNPAPPRHYASGGGIPDAGASAPAEAPDAGSALQPNELPSGVPQGAQIIPGSIITHEHPDGSKTTIQGGARMAPSLQPFIVQGPNGPEVKQGFPQPELKSLQRVQAPGAKPTAAAPKSGATASPSPLAGFDKAQEASAAAEKATLGAQQATAERAGSQKEADLLKEQQVNLDFAQKQEGLRSEYDRSYERGINEYRQAVSDFSNSQVDPGRFWASKSTGSKMLAAIGTFLGGLNGGTNQALGIINKAVDDDIAAQKEHISQLRDVADSKKYLLGQMRDKFQDDNTSLSATKGAMLGWAKSLADAHAAKFQGTAQGLEFQKLADGLGAGVAKTEFDAGHTIRGEAIERTKANAAVMEAEARVKAAGGKGQSTEDLEKQIDAFGDELKKSPVWNAGLDQKRKMLLLAIQEGMGERFSPEVMKALDDAIPGRLSGFADKYLGRDWVDNRLGAAKSYMRAAHNAKANLPPSIGAQ